MKLTTIKEYILRIKKYILKVISSKLTFIGKYIKKYISKVISSKIDVTKIIVDHYHTLYNNKSGKKRKDLFTFFGIPIIVSAILIFLLNGKLNTDISNSLLMFLSIFTPILFSLLVAIYSINRKRLTKRKTHQIVKEFKSNISFLIIISLVSIFLLVIYSMKLSENDLYLQILTFIIIFLFGVIGLTLLQVLKRWNVLLDRTLDEIEPPKEPIL